MPWKELKPMDQKIQFIADYTRQVGSISELCQRYGISRKTGYKWIQRYTELGLSGLAEQSKKPQYHPLQTPLKIRRRIIEIRNASRIPLGAKKISVILAQELAAIDVPSPSTINNILKAEGLVKPRRKRRRVSPYGKALRAGSKPNDLWSVDFKGQFKLTNRQWCYPLTVMDDYSRYLLAIESQRNVRTVETRKSFERLFCEFGLPERIRSDNGVPFATKATGGLSALSIWWIKLGIRPERIAAGQPQQNGRHERMHKTLKAAATKPPSASFSSQQRRFDVFRGAYNSERPHEALFQQMPRDWFTPSSRTYPCPLMPIEYPRYFEVRKVASSGVVYWHSGQAYISHLLAGEWVGLEEIGENIYDVYFSFYRLGRLDMNLVSENAGGKYWSIKV